MISSSTFRFLKDVKENNNREWFQANKQEYENARTDVLNFTAGIIKELAKADITIPADLDPKSCVMRIYRDIRFSKNKTPFKTNFGIAISSNGKNFKGPGYYIHLEPGKSFIAGGTWFPESDELKSIRQEIDYNSSDWHEIVDEKAFRDEFGELDTEGKLKTVPKGYSSDHPDIEYLKLKSFTAGRQLSDKELLKADSEVFVSEKLKKLNPLMVFLRNAIS